MLVSRKCRVLEGAFRGRMVSFLVIHRFYYFDFYSGIPLSFISMSGTMPNMNMDGGGTKKPTTLDL